MTQRSPESRSAASFGTTMRETMQNKKNHLERVTERFKAMSERAISHLF
ncbi:hypothetical protein HMPREF9541_00109 [Escherichia coli MS 116-1]|uniref:Uncharacterized protein n=1 Tax=Escherichia coli TaxID=562 RepID=A0A7U1E0D2_ECOLX|nr:hypothetical protein HMPREF9541_00109 [Escherichia coli MS 116-1]QQZ46538.1 hypothetical protein [Escherichia coli]QQZ48514.1 hypothetical protein [Escherichia coli]